MNNTIEAQGELAQEMAAAQNHIEAVDALTDAVLTGEAPADIHRLEAAADADRGQVTGDGGGQWNHDGAQASSPESERVGDARANAEAIGEAFADDNDNANAGAEADVHSDAGANPDAAVANPETHAESAEMEGRGLPKKVRLGEGDMAVALLRKSRPDLSWAEAEQIITGGVARDGDRGNDSYIDNTHDAVAQGEPAPAVQRVEELAGALANVQAQLDEAARNESLFTPEIRELQRMERELEMQVATAQAGAMQEAARHRQIADDSRSESLRTASQLYPELTAPGAALWQEAYRIATDPSHPDHHPDVVHSHNAPLLIAKIAAANLGMRAPGGAPVIHEQVSMVRPASGAKSTAPQPPRLSAQEALRASEAATLEAIENGSSGHSRNSGDKPYLLV